MAIDTKKKESPLTVARRLAAKWLNNPVIDQNGDGKNTKKVKNIFVTFPENAVWLCWTKEDEQSLENHARAKKQKVVEVLRDGKEIKETKEEVEENNDDNSDEDFDPNSTGSNTLNHAAHNGKGKNNNSKRV